jgi:hypothetical protein
MWDILGEILGVLSNVNLASSQPTAPPQEPPRTNVPLLICATFAIVVLGVGAYFAQGFFLTTCAIVFALLMAVIAVGGFIMYRQERHNRRGFDVEPAPHDPAKLKE